MTKHIMKSKTETPKHDWETPKWLFDKLNQSFHFEIDLASNASNSKCPVSYTKSNSAFDHAWSGMCFCNPPFSELKTLAWTGRAFEQCVATGGTVCMILPVATETRWWQSTVFRCANTILFLDRRINYEYLGVVQRGVTFASVVAVYSMDPSVHTKFRNDFGDMGYMLCT